VVQVWKDVEVYVVGGINYGIKDHFGKMQLKKDANGNAIVPHVLENVWDYTLADLKAAQDNKCVPYEAIRETAPRGAFKWDKKTQEWKENKYYRELCFKYTYLIQVLNEFGIPEGKKIHFRAKVDGKHEAQWVRSAVMKEKNPDSDALRSYDTKAITELAIRDWEALQQTHAAPGTLI
jgi:hypothetical protein